MTDRSPRGTNRMPKPSRERRVDGRDTARAVGEALNVIQARPDHDPETGKFLPGNTAAGNTLERSEAFWEAVREAKAGLVKRLRSDLAINGDAAATLEGLIEAYSEARLVRSAMFHRMVELGGPITTKGKTRALFASYLQALDREVRLATTLGLERRAKAVPSLAEYLERRKVETADTERGDDAA